MGMRKAGGGLNVKGGEKVTLRVGGKGDGRVKGRGKGGGLRVGGTGRWLRVGGRVKVGGKGEG
jgi:hypothetical protein